MPLISGQTLQGRYRIVSLLGQGGMGAVYQAWDTRLNVPVALKEMIPQPGIDLQTLTQLRAQFQQEATVLARLDHPHLVRVTDFFEEDGNDYLAMDFVAGESLENHIDQHGALAEGQVLTWARQLTDALSYCHDRNVIHRDIKPQNIIIRSNDQVELVDFGLVKLWDPDDPFTHTAMRGMGTPEYAPPEQYGTRPGHTDPRSDIYSLGATLYHALTGQAPPSAGDRMARPDLFVPPRQLAPQVSPSTEAMVLKAMEMPVSSRFQSAREMEATIENLIAAVGLSPPTGRPAGPKPTAHPAAPPSSRPVRRRWPRIGRSVLGVGAAVIGVAVIGGLVALGAWGIATLAGRQPHPTPATHALQPTSTPFPIRPASGTPIPPSSQPVLAGTAVPLPAEPISSDNANRLIQLARWGKGQIEQVAYSPDGQELAVASSVGVYLYDGRTLEQLALMESDQWVRSVAFSPGGETVAAGAEDQVMLLWPTGDDGPVIETLGRHSMRVTSVAFSGDGTLLASGSWDDTARIWQMSDGGIRFTLTGHQNNVDAVAFSPDGRLVATGSADGTIRLWQVSDGTVANVLSGHSDGVTSVAFSLDGTLLASGSEDETVQLWRVSTGRRVQVLDDGHTHWIASLAFSPHEPVLASGAWDRTIRLWEIDTGAQVSRFEHRGGYVKSLSFSPDGQTLACCLSNQVLHLQQVSDGAIQYTIQDHTADVAYVAASVDGRLVASGADYDVIRLWPVSDGTSDLTLESDGIGLKDLAFSPVEPVLAAAAGGQIDLWNVDDVSQRKLELEKGQEGWVRSVAFAPDGQTVASGWDDGDVRLWNVADRTLLRVLRGHADDVVSVAFSPDGSLLATASHDETAGLWQVSDGSRLQTLSGHSSWVTSVAFSPDGDLLATGSWDDTVNLWQTATGRLVHVLDDHGDDVERVIFSPDGSLLVSASADNTLGVWRRSDGALLRKLEGHTGDVDGVAFTAGGTLLVSGSQDGTLRLWGVSE